jgi:hypothetical protein
MASAALIAPVRSQRFDSSSRSKAGSGGAARHRSDFSDFLALSVAAEDDPVVGSAISAPQTAGWAAVDCKFKIKEDVDHERRGDPGVWSTEVLSRQSNPRSRPRLQSIAVTLPTKSWVWQRLLPIAEIDNRPYVDARIARAQLSGANIRGERMAHRDDE